MDLYLDHNRGRLLTSGIKAGFKCSWKVLAYESGSRNCSVECTQVIFEQYHIFFCCFTLQRQRIFNDKEESATENHGKCSFLYFQAK